MLLFCIGLASGGFQDYSRPVSPRQKSAAKSYVRALGSGKKEDKRLQQFPYSLFKQDKGDSSQYELTVYQFLVLYSFREDGHISNADTITQYISALAFLGWAAIFEEIRKSMESDKKIHGK